jgi:DNA-binding MarR family transcriptional regulator
VAFVAACDVRFDIFVNVAAGAIDGSSLAARLQLDQSTVSRYLNELRALRAVAPTRTGRRILYSLGPAADAKFHDGGGMDVSIRSDDSFVSRWTISPEQLARILKSNR